MYKLIIRTLNTNEEILIAFRENAEILAEQYYKCDDVYCVEIMDNTTGEILYLKAKG